MNMTMPASLSIDTAKLSQPSADSTNFETAGIFSFFDGSIVEVAFPMINNSTSFGFNKRGSAGGFITGGAFGATQSIGGRSSWPISGWTSNKG